MFDAVMNLKKDLYTKLLEKLEIKLSVEERELEGIYGHVSQICTKQDPFLNPRHSLIDAQI